MTLPRPDGDPKRGEVILIPKPLRLEWLDVAALDAELSNAAFRLAAVLGVHFNRYRGNTYISLATLASITGWSERTVWAALQELERRGYILVKRRELGTRADGRRVCGGRGVANVYLPAFERSQISATTRGQSSQSVASFFGKKGRNESAERSQPTTSPPLIHLR